MFLIPFLILAGGVLWFATAKAQNLNRASTPNTPTFSSNVSSVLLYSGNAGMSPIQWAQLYPAAADSMGGASVVAEAQAEWYQQSQDTVPPFISGT